MRRFSKLFTVVVAGALAFGAVHTFADEPQNIHNYIPYETEEQRGYGDEAVTIPNFMSFTGQVTEIHPVYDNEGNAAYNQSFITVKNDYDATVVFRTDYNTFVLGSAVEVGDNITGWYATGVPMILIYPPQHTAQVIVNGEFENVKIDRFRFDEAWGALISDDGQLVLNFNEETPILLQDGQEFEVMHEGYTMLNGLDGRILVVTYGPTNRMYPGGTIPGDPSLKVVVLWERAEHPIGNIDDFDSLPQVEDPNLMEAMPIEWTSNEGISVNNQMLDVTWRQVDDVFYVPFRATVNALGFGHTVQWDGDNMMVSANNGTYDIHFPIGAYHFIVGNSIITLDHHVILEDSTTFVPWQFFRDVFGVNAWLNAGQIFIDNEYAMQ